MSRRDYLLLVTLGACCGVLLSIAYVKPYTNQIRLSEMVLQLSGARGTFILETTPGELLSYCAKTLPYLLFELYFGIHVYRHFCTASVYIFSRTPHRIRWYIKECLALIVAIVLFQTVMLAMTIATTWLRHELIWDMAGVKLLIIHALLYTFWTFAMTLLVNLFSITYGSGTAFTITFGGQTVLLVLLSVLTPLENNVELYAFVMNINPMSHLVIGWHSAAIEWTGYLTVGIVSTLSLFSSFAYLSLIAVVVGIAGAICIQRQDVIVADSEFGGI